MAKRGRPKKVDFDYLPHDKWFKFNDNDKELTPIYISLPDPPDLELIDGYGMQPNDQFFRRESIPPKLTALEKRVSGELLDDYERNKTNTVTPAKIITRYWEILEKESDYYANEIQWIKKVVWYCIHGYWFFNKGKPTYIAPWHYELLNFWYVNDIADKYFEYRERDREKILIDWYSYNSTETFAKTDEKTYHAIKNEDGTYEMIDLGKRVFYGTIKPKNRRSGETNQGISEVWSVCRKKAGGSGYIVSKTGDDAKKYYHKMLIPAWQKYPLFLKPVWDGDNHPASLKLTPPSNDYYTKGLNTTIEYVDSAGEKKLDGMKIYGLIQDEQGKSESGGGKKVDVSKRWAVNKEAMAQGGNIHGFCTNPSTVEEMNEGGETFAHMFTNSNFYIRTPNGQTLEGLLAIFQPAQHGRENYIDPWGRSVIEDPSKELVRETKEFLSKYKTHKKFYYLNGKGAKSELQGEGDALLAKGDAKSITKYRSLRRKQPMEFSDCWLGTSGDLGLPILLIDERIAQLRIEKQQANLGYFAWRNGRGSDVVWINDPEMKMSPHKIWFEMFEDAPYAYRNKTREEYEPHPTKIGEHRVVRKPYYSNIFTAGADPVGYHDELSMDSGTSRSDFSFNIMVNPLENDEGKPMDEWNGYRCVLDSRVKGADQTACNEQVLMACIYYGALLYPETNKEDLWKYVVENGYSGYLKYDMKIVNGKSKVADRPGWYASTEKKQEGFNLLSEYLTHRIHTEKSIKFLEECKEIRSIKQMTKYDRIASRIATLHGCQSKYGETVDNYNNMDVDMGSLFRKRRFG